MKALAIGALLALTLTACSDRVRDNCTRNKALSTVTSSEIKCK